MIKNSFKIGIIILAVIAMNSCRKENSKEDVVKNEPVQKSTDFPFNILNLCSFDFTTYIEGEDVEFTETVTDGVGMSYDIFITNQAVAMDAWTTAKTADGKTTQTVISADGLHAGIAWKEQCSHHRFIIVTEAEKQFLCNPESIEDFKMHMSNYIDLAVDEMDCYFVFHVENGIVRNEVLGKTSTTYASWVNRLHGYVEIAKNYPIIDLDDNEYPPDGACQNFSKKKDAKQFAKDRMEEEDVISVCMMKRRPCENCAWVWTVCWERE